MSRSLKSLWFLLLLLSPLVLITGCRSDGQTARIDYTYQKPIWTDASFEKPADSKR